MQPAKNHPAEHGIEFDVVVAADLHTDAGKLRPFPSPAGGWPAKKGSGTIARLRRLAILYFEIRLSLGQSPLGASAGVEKIPGAVHSQRK